MILHIYAGNLYGGIETHLKTLAEFENGPGRPHSGRHQVALCFEGRLARELRNLGKPPWILGDVRFRYPWTVARARRELRDYLNQNPVSHIVAHAAWSYKLAWPVANARKIPISFWNHDILSGQTRLEKFAARHSPFKLITNSQFTRQSVETAFNRPVDAVIHPVTRFVNLTNRSVARNRLRQEFKTPQDALLITQFSRFERWKGHERLISALGQLKENPDWHLWLVGGTQRPAEDKYREELARLAESLGIRDRVRFPGQRNDIHYVLAASDIHCQLNLSPEPFGLAYVEALAAGIPTVGTNFGGASEIITTECGRLVPPADENALAETLLSLIRDPALRDDLGKAGPAQARRLCDPVAALASLEQTLFAPVEKPHGRKTAAARHSNPFP